MNARALIFAVSVMVGVITVPGCETPQPQNAQHTADLPTPETELIKLKDHLEKLQESFTEQAEQIRSLQGLGVKRLEKLFYAERIELTRHTGGVNTDGIDGDDAIKVYLRPIDRDGSVLKAAGDVRIRLFDLAAAANANLIAEYEWTVEEISEHWSSGFLAYHFSFVCPFKTTGPAHDEITVRAEFTDYLTGKVLSAQKLCKVSIPSETPPEK